MTSNEYSFTCPLDSRDLSSTYIPISSSGISVSIRFTLPQPSSLLGISRVPISSAPKISIALTSEPWGAGRSAISIIYSLTKAAAPAAAGVAIDVPLDST